MRNNTGKYGKERFFRYRLTIGERLAIEEELVQIGKRAPGNESNSMTVTFVEFPLFFRADCERANNNAVPCDYDAYSGLTASAVHPVLLNWTR